MHSLKTASYNHFRKWNRYRNRAHWPGWSWSGWAAKDRVTFLEEKLRRAVSLVRRRRFERSLAFARAKLLTATLSGQRITDDGALLQKALLQKALLQNAAAK